MFPHNIVVTYKIIKVTNIIYQVILAEEAHIQLVRCKSHISLENNLVTFIKAENAGTL